MRGPERGSLTARRPPLSGANFPAVTLTPGNAGGLSRHEDVFAIQWHRAAQLGALSLKHALPAIFQTREFTTAGGLMSYGSSASWQYRLLASIPGAS